MTIPRYLTPSNQSKPRLHDRVILRSLIRSIGKQYLCMKRRILNSRKPFRNFFFFLCDDMMCGTSFRACMISVVYCMCGITISGGDSMNSLSVFLSRKTHEKFALYSYIAVLSEAYTLCILPMSRTTEIFRNLALPCNSH